MKATLGIISMFLLISTCGFAGNGSRIGRDALDRLMNRKIFYPESLRAQHIEATVSVKLKINEKAKIEIVSIQSDSEEMKAAVEHQVMNLKYKATPGLIGSEFDYTFTFKVQE